ncbi:MAG: SIMPL domain-containing protein [Alphaproteobacteria bacterium]|nr:SIMPL domain-containing protein [Alphaproteobacteria bacterium]
MTRSALSVVVAAAALSATLATAPPAFADTAPVKPYDPAVVRVSGRAELYLPPDQARVTVGFYNAGRTSAEATDLVGKRARALEAALRIVDAARVTIERSDTTVSPVMKAGGDRRPDRINGYEANTSVTVLVRDLAALPQTVEAAVNAAPDTFADIAFSIRDTQTARTKAREAAIKDAVDKARVYTEGAGFKLGRLLLVEEGGSNMYAQSGNRGIRMERAAMADSAPAVVAPPIAAEPQLYTAEVSVVYEVGAALAPK